MSWSGHAGGNHENQQQWRPEDECIVSRLFHILHRDLPPRHLDHLPVHALREIAMKNHIIFEVSIGIAAVAIGWLLGHVAGQASRPRVGTWPDHPVSVPAAATVSAPDAAVLPDRYPRAFMVQDRAGHISSSKVWKFEDDWFADGGKLGCRRFSTDGATLEFCLDPYHTGSGCTVPQDRPIYHTHGDR